MPPFLDFTKRWLPFFPTGLTLIGACLRARDPEAQQSEVAIGVAVLNRMLAAARPNSVRCKVHAA
ncbi:hypothetical protein KDW41_30410 [Burkholderia vietnamiensis]|nr:hypothetical protein [Burkholderia vietnamiensis]